MTGIGHNGGPALDAFDTAITDLRTEAGNFLDGAAIENEGQANAVGVIISTAKKMRKDADAIRKTEKEPHLEAGRAVDASYKPVFEQLDAIVKAAQAPLSAWLNAQAEKQREAERLARIEADRLAQEAIEAERASAGNVEGIEAATALRKEAEAADRAANKAAKAKPLVTGMDRAVGLRTYKNVEVTDSRAALLWIAKRDKPAMDAFVADYARKNAPARPMDGVTVTEEKRVA